MSTNQSISDCYPNNAQLCVVKYYIFVLSIATTTIYYYSILPRMILRFYYSPSADSRSIVTVVGGKNIG